MLIAERTGARATMTGRIARGRIACLLLFFLCCGNRAEPGGGSPANPAPATDPEDVRRVVEGNTAFALDLYREILRKEAGKNLFFSPYSVSTALAMAYAGARNVTEREMAETLCFALPQDELAAASPTGCGTATGSG